MFQKMGLWVWLCAPIWALAANVPLQRFERWMPPLENAFRMPTTPAQAAETLLSRGGREAAFQLQGLSRIYSAEDDAFKSTRDAFRDLEDAIGKVDEWRKARKAAEKKGAGATVIAELQAQEALALDELRTHLEDADWVDIEGKNRLQKIHRFLRSYSFGKYTTDRERVLTALGKQLKKVRDTSYDVRFLEKREPLPAELEFDPAFSDYEADGNGLHELRRELRWFLIETRALNGLVQFSDSCPLAEVRHLLDDEKLVSDKYSNIEVSGLDKKPCFISRCLFLEVVRKVGQIGDIKDDAERAIKMVDPDGSRKLDLTPTHYEDRGRERNLAEEARALYEEVRRFNVVEALRDELKACR